MMVPIRYPYGSRSVFFIAFCIFNYVLPPRGMPQPCRKRKKFLLLQTSNNKRLFRPVAPPTSGVFPDWHPCDMRSSVPITGTGQNLVPRLFQFLNRNHFIQARRKAIFQSNIPAVICYNL